MLLEGMHIPLLTPFHPDGRLHLGKLEGNVARYSLTPAAGIVVLGPGSEANLLSDEERRAVLRSAMGAAGATKVMMAGVARESVRETLRLIEDAAGMRYDVALVDAPEFAGCLAKEQRLFLEMVADEAALPIVLTGAMPVEWMAGLASHSKVLGYLDHGVVEGVVRQLCAATEGVRRTVTVTSVFAAVTGRMQAEAVGGGLLSAESLLGGATGVAQRSAPPTRTRTKMVGFQLLTGTADRMLEGLDAGATGVVPGLSAAAPQGCYEVYAAWKDGDLPLAAEKQARLVRAAEWMGTEASPAPVKYAADLNGYFGGLPRLPLLPLLGADRVKVEELMMELKS